MKTRDNNYNSYSYVSPLHERLDILQAFKMLLMNLLTCAQVIMSRQRSCFLPVIVLPFHMQNVNV